MVMQYALGLHAAKILVCIQAKNVCNSQTDIDTWVVSLSEGLQRKIRSLALTQEIWAVD